MSEAIEQLLRLIPESDVSNESLDVNGILGAFASIERLDDSALNVALAQVLLRTIETFLLADHQLLELSLIHI